MYGVGANNFNVSVKFLADIKSLTDGINRGITSVNSFGERINSFGSRIGKFVFSLKGLVSGFLALQVIRQVTGFIKACTAASEEQIIAEVSLTAALKAKNQYTEEGMVSLKKYATELQSLTGIGDEATLSMMAQAEAIAGLSSDQLPKYIKAVLQLANVYNMDYQSAAQLVSKSLVSNRNYLARYGIEIDMTASKEEKLNQITNKTSAGWAILMAKTNTLIGAVAILKAQWGEFLEKLGDTITKSPLVVAAIKIIANWLYIQTQKLGDLNMAYGDLVGKTFVAVIRGCIAVGRAFLWVAQTISLAHIGLLKWIGAYQKSQGGLLVKVGGILGKVSPKLGAPFAAAGAILGIGGAGTQKAEEERTESLAALIAERNALNDLDQQLANLAVGSLPAASDGFKTLGDVQDDQTKKTTAGKEALEGWAKAALKAREAAYGGRPEYEPGRRTEILRKSIESHIEDWLSWIGLTPGGVAMKGAAETRGQIPTRPETTFEEGPLQKRHREDAESRISKWMGDTTEKVTSVFQDLGEAINNAILALVESIQSGDLAGALQNVFTLLGQAIGKNVTAMINAGNSAGSGIFAGALGALGGGLVGVGISLLGGLFGGGNKDRGAVPSKPIYTWDTHWDSFFKMGMTLPFSFVYSGRSGGYGVDPHGRTLAGYSTGQHFDS